MSCLNTQFKNKLFDRNAWQNRGEFSLVNKASYVKRNEIAKR